VSVVNAANPGTHDVAFVDPEHRPLWIEDCADDRACARFDGIDDHGVADGLTLVTGDRPSLIAVLAMNAITDATAIPFQLTNEEGTEFMNLPEVRPADEGVWRYNGSYTATPHNIDFGPSDLDLHLHESHLASPATLAIFDGVQQQNVGGDSAVTGPVTRVSLGRRAPFEYAACDIFEAIVVDAPTLDEARRYRDQRAALEYPSIPLP
jgi:hypothetical protein